MKGRKERVHDGIQVLVSNGGQLDQTHPLVVGTLVGNMVHAAIDCDLVPTLD
jgi:hypothetical protein